MMGGQSGGRLITGTSVQTGLSATSIIVNTDAVFSEFFVDGENVLTARGLNGKTVKAGMFIGAGLEAGAGGLRQMYITRIKLVSGSVMIY